ncbi:MAG: FtsX-like permease family protein, partial [Pseudomonadota bacterium]
YHSVSLKAVSPGYPVHGSVRIRAADRQERRVTGVPDAGAAWLDERALRELGAAPGDTVQIGQATFVVAAELLFEPDRLTQLQHTLPRVLIGYSDLGVTGLQFDTGRVEFRYLFDGSDSDLQRLEAYVETIATESVEVLKPAAGSHPFSRMSERANRFLGMVSVLATVLCGSAAAVLAGFMVKRYSAPSAILRCFGAERRVVAWALMIQLGVGATIAGVAGAIAGWLAQYALAGLLQPYLTPRGPAFSVAVAAVAIGSGLITVLVFVLPRLTALGRLPIAGVLRDQAEAPGRNALSVLVAAAFVIAALWVYNDNARLTAIIGVGVVSVIVLAIVLGWVLSKLAGSLHRVAGGGARVALRSIGRSPSRHVTSMATIAIAIMALLMTQFLRGAFLDRYHVQQLQHDGNCLFTGLPSSQLQDFERALTAHGATIAVLHPTVRAHLVSIDGVAVEQALSRESDVREEIRSPVRLSWSEHLPDNNTLQQGRWPLRGSGEVSVDAEVMSDLGLSLGDVLGFRVGQRHVSATIGGQRAFKGGGSSMMFWFMFAPDALASLDHTFMGGLQIRDNARAVQSDLSRLFPNVVVTDLEQHLSRIRDIMAAITRVMDAMMNLLVGAAFVVILAIAMTTSRMRRRQSAVLHSLGVSSGRLSRMMLIEYFAVGLVAGLIGVAAAHLGATLMFRYQFAMSYSGALSNYLLIPPAAALAVAFIGYVFNRGHTRRPPLRLLQQA